MKNLFLIAAFIISATAFAQITINNPAPGTTRITESNVLFNLNYLSFYIKTEDNKIEPFKITRLEQEYTTVILEESNLKPHEKSIPLYTIHVSGTHKSNGIRNVYFTFQFTNLDAFLATISLLENYDRKGKIVISKAAVDPQASTNAALERIANPRLPGSTNEKPIFPIQNDILEFIHNGSIQTF